MSVILIVVLVALLFDERRRHYDPSTDDFGDHDPYDDNDYQEHT